MNNESKIISIVNQKGGVGKTTTVLNIAAALAVLGNKTLVIDFDPQGNLSSGLGIDDRSETIYNVLCTGTEISKVIAKTKIENLNIIPSDMNLAAFEIEIIDKNNREYILDKKLNEIKNKYDFIIIDCPPSLGLLTVNSLTTSNSIIIPLQCEFFALEGLSHLLETSERIKSNFNSKLHIDGILLTMYDKRNKLTEQIERDVRDYLGELVYENVIPRNVKLAESTSFGMPAIIYDMNCSGSIAYINFVKELVKRNVRSK